MVYGRAVRISDRGCLVVVSRLSRILFFSLLLVFLPFGGTAVPGGSAAAQEVGGATGETLSIFFDCQARGCRDLDYFRREIPYVNWVRNREDADVHVLVTSRRSGGGGLEYSLAFLGQGDLAGSDLTLVTHTSGDATEDDRRAAVAQKLRLGLVRYLADRPIGDRLKITLAGPGASPGPEAPSPAGAGPKDPWDFWVFRVTANGFVNGESSIRFANYFGTVSANRTTEAWKIILGANRSENIQEFELSDRTIKETRTDWGVNGAVVRSVGARWAVGLRTDVGSSTFLNQDLRWSVRPGLEFNFFPYEESSRRSLTLQYLVGPWHWDYAETTIFGLDEETRWKESLTARLSLVQPWGRWTTSVSGSHFFNDSEHYNMNVFASVNVRLFKGFSVRVTGNYSWVRDQIYLAAGGATQEEILLRQRQIETSYRYFTSFGIEYRFGSIFNNVVNPRFGGGGGNNIEIIF
ncbi:MAG: hypothetical protein ACE5GJ_00020 [Gemmatimonadota bacterium]